MKGLVGEGDVIQGPWKNPVAAQKTNAAKLASEFLSSQYAPHDLENEDIEDVAEYIVEFLLKYHEELTDTMDIDDIDLLAKRISREAFIQSDLLDEALEENLNKWFKEKWVRFGPDGKIRGACARGDDSEGKPKCLPQSKAHSLGNKGRKYAASKKRREDPNPERTGKAKNVATKKKTNEEQLDELKCWSGYTRVQGVPAGAPGSCKKKTNEEDGEKCPHCGGELVSEEMMNEKQDACYRKVKSRYKVWPSAYASGALVQCRKKGASNWGTGGKKDESSIMKGIVDEEWTHGHERGNTSHWSGEVNSGSYTHAGEVVARYKGFEHPSTFTQSHIKVKFLPTGKVKQFRSTGSGFAAAEKWILSNLGADQNESIDEAGSPAQQAAIAIAMKKAGKKPKNEATYTSPGDTKLPMDEAYRQARHITKQIKYDQTVSEILTSIQILAEKAGISEKELQDAENEVFAAESALESAVYGLDEVFKEALERQRYAQDDEDFISEAKAKQYVKPYNDPQTGKQIGWKSSDGYHVKYWRLTDTAKAKAYQHAKISPDEVQEDYSGMYAAEKTPKINPYAGIKDREFRGAISEISDTNINVNQTGGFITPEYDDAYARLKRVSPRLFDYIRYDAPIPLDPILTLKALRQMQGNEEAVLRMMKQGLAQDTKAMYGDKHPSAMAESVNRFWNKILNETPTDNPTGASGEGGWRIYRAKPAGEIEEDTAYAGGMGQGGNAGQSYRKFKPKMAGVIKKESSIMKGLRNEGE